MKVIKKQNWDKYGLFILTNRLHWLKSTNPKIYNFFNKKGVLVFQTADERYVGKYKKKGYRIRLVNNKKEIKNLEQSIKNLGG